VRPISADGSETAVDTVIWSTTCRPALQHLVALDVLEDDGRVAVDHYRSFQEPRLWLAGYDRWAGLGSATMVGALQTARDLTTSLYRSFGEALWLKERLLLGYIT